MTIKQTSEAKKAQEIIETSASDIIYSESSVSWYNNLLGNCKECLKKIYGISSKNSAARYLQDAVMLLLLAGLLCYGAAWEIFRTDADAAHYQCYAVAFWQGWSGFQKLPPEQCTFINYPDKDLTIISQDGLLHTMQQWKLPSGLIHFVAAQPPDQPYHALPYEYPWPMLLPFSLGLVVPAHWYQIAFAIGMLLLAGCIYFVLQHWCSRRVALTYLLYLLVGGWSTVVARFDMIPAALTLFAVICAAHKRWNWAFALLALATLSKFYPATLLIPFLLALQQGTQGKWYAWRRWLPMGVFVGVCVLVIGVSLLLSVVGTLTPLGFFNDRPVQVESLSASILWMFSLLGKTSLTYVYTFGSLNVLSPLSSAVTSRMVTLLVVGLSYTWWLQWRGRIDLAMACLLTLLIVMITGKVFSAQYLIWVIPLAAYVGQSNRWWLLFWTLLGLLTSWIYPYIYSMVTPDFYIPLLYPVTAVRNILLLGFILFVLTSVSCRSVEQPLPIFKPSTCSSQRAG
jgi:hypothetical protein